MSEARLAQRGQKAIADNGEDLPDVEEEAAEDFDDAPSEEREAAEEELVDSASAARTVAELELERRAAGIARYRRGT